MSLVWNQDYSSTYWKFSEALKKSHTQVKFTWIESVTIIKYSINNIYKITQWRHTCPYNDTRCTHHQFTTVEGWTYSYNKLSIKPLRTYNARFYHITARRRVQLSRVSRAISSETVTGHVRRSVFTTRREASCTTWARHFAACLQHVSWCHLARQRSAGLCHAASRGTAPIPALRCNWGGTVWPSQHDRHNDRIRRCHTMRSRKNKWSTFCTIISTCVATPVAKRIRNTNKNYKGDFCHRLRALRIHQINTVNPTGK